MALCGGVGASALPSELIVHIFSFLSARDKLRASAVCARWRECLFYPALWTELRLSLGGGPGPEETPKLEFLMRKFGSFVRELQLEFAPVEGYLGPLHGGGGPGRAAEEEAQFAGRWRDALHTYLDQVLCVLRGLRNNRPVRSGGGTDCVGMATSLLPCASDGNGSWSPCVLGGTTLREACGRVDWLDPESPGACGLGGDGAGPRFLWFPTWPVIACTFMAWDRNSDVVCQQEMFHVGVELVVFPGILNLQKLSLYGDTCILQEEGILDRGHLSQVDQAGKKIKEIQLLFEEILANSRQVKWLSSAFMLGMVTPSSLSMMSNLSASSLEHLSLLDSQLPSLVPVGELERLHGLRSLVPVGELERLHGLRSLALDFCDFTSEMCRLLSGRDHAPLHRLSLLLSGAAVPDKPLDATPSEGDWKTLVRHSANLRVYVMALDVPSQDLLRVLKPSLPLERIHFDSYSCCASEGTVELISLQYPKTLTHFILMRDPVEREDTGFPDLSDNRNEDPLVLLAWRCTRLSLLVIHGYTVWAHNLIAISRLRGSNLKVLAVSEESIDFDQDQLLFVEEDPVHNLIKEVSLGLGRPWHPMMDTSVVLSEPTQHFYREMQRFSEGV
ncbi:FBX33 protein, partial [Atractosteus spatula]|nr:FBX33 protein [Atractosteus spatula]